MHFHASLYAALLGIASSAIVLAAPTKRTGESSITCDAISNGGFTDLTSGSLDGDTGGVPIVTLGYKKVTSSSDQTTLYVVSSNSSDPTVVSFKAQQQACNSTSLNYYGTSKTEYEVNTPVKLPTDVNQDGKSYCVGVESHYTQTSGTGTAALGPTAIILMPCESTDDAYVQSNQFWLSAYKYLNLSPLIGASPTKHVNGNNTWPILPPAENSSTAEYTAVRFDSADYTAKKYRSFYTQ